jgi:glutamate 5-kinase
MSVEDRKLDQVAGDSGSALGRGGMLSKIRAARIAARSGANTVIASGHETDVLLRWQRGETPGTLLCASQAPVVARKQWLAGQLQVQGRLTLDRGAVDVLQQKGSSLLAVGVTAVSGSFERGSVVVCWDEHGQEVGRGLSNYNAAEARRIMGYSSHEIEGILGYMDEPELIHRDNLVLTDC